MTDTGKNRLPWVICGVMVGAILIVNGTTVDSTSYNFVSVDCSIMENRDLADAFIRQYENTHSFDIIYSDWDYVDDVEWNKTNCSYLTQQTQLDAMFKR